MLKVEIVKVNVSAESTDRTIDFVAEEKPLRIFVNKIHYATIFCSPSNLKELAVGHVFSQGIIRSIGEIEKIRFKKNEACHIRLKSDLDIEKRLKLSTVLSRVILSACGSPSAYPSFGKLPRIKSNVAVEAEVILECVKRLNSLAEIFKQTGGVHSAAIFSKEGNHLAFAEDVGRHNAVDKVIGSGILKNEDFDECFLTTTGRLTGNMVLKAARARLPIVASLAAAINSGVAVAKDVGLTLIGFARGRRMNIYSCSERILV